MKIVINGAGIGGTTLAYWLRKSGHEVVLVERAPRLRTGGYLIDFWGGGYDVAEKMGLMPTLKALGYRMEEVWYVDEEGHKTGGFSVDVFRRATHDRFTDVRRSDLSSTIFGAIEGEVETRFGDSVAEIEDSGNRVHVTFAHSEPCDADLVVGAGGLHSRVRKLLFGRDKDVEVPLGYHVAAFEVEGYSPRDELVAVNYSAPGRLITRLSLRDDRSIFLFVFRDEYLHDRAVRNDSDRKAAIRDAYGEVGWEAPRILDAMETATDIYFDSVSQIHLDSWTKGRTALIGDAAACVSLLAGEGTGLAMMDAYVLAGELHRANGDYATAFSNYQGLMKPFVEKKQRSSVKFASALAPKTELGIHFRNAVTRLDRLPYVADFLVERELLHDDITIPEYQF